MAGVPAHAQGWGVTADIYAEGFIEPSCLDFKFTAPASTPLGFEVKFWVPTYYIEVVTEREQTLLFPPHGTNFLRKLADVTKVESSKKVVMKAIGDALPGFDWGGLSTLLSSSVDLKGRTGVNDAGGGGIQFRDVHVWKYNNPEFVSELFQILICHAADAMLPEMFQLVENNYKIPDYLPPQKDTPIIFPVYFSEVDWFQWNTGLFDLSFGEGLGLGKKVIWEDDSVGRSTAIQQYARKGVVASTDPLLSSFQMALRGFSRAATALSGKLVEHGDVFAEPSKYQFNAIWPEKTGCFAPENDADGNITITIPAEYSVSARRTDPTKFARQSSYGFIVWTEAGDTSKLQQCLMTSLSDMAAAEAAKYAPTCSVTTVFSGPTCEIALAAIEAASILAKIVDVVNKLRTLYSQIRQAIAMVEHAVECLGEISDLVGVVAKADVAQTPSLPACQQAFPGGSIEKVFRNLNTVISVVRFGGTIQTIGSQVLADKIHGAVRVKCAPGDLNAIPPVAPEDAGHCAIRNGAPEACDDLFGGSESDRKAGKWTIDEMGDLFNRPPDEVAALFPHLPATAGDFTALDGVCLDRCPPWCPLVWTPMPDPWQGCQGRILDTNPPYLGQDVSTLNRVARDRLCDAPLASVHCGQGFYGALRPDVRQALAGVAVKHLPLDLEARDVIRQCQVNRERYRDKDAGVGLFSGLANQALETLAAQSPAGPFAGCVPTGKPRPGEIARCVEDKVYEDIRLGGSGSTLGKAILSSAPMSALPQPVQDGIRQGMDLAKEAHDLNEQLKNNPAPEVVAAEKWAQYEYDLRLWEERQRRGRNLPKPVPPDPAVHPEPKDACGWLADAGKTDSDAYKVFGCGITDAAQKVALEESIKPKGLCDSSTTEKTPRDPADPLSCPALDWNADASLVECSRSNATDMQHVAGGVGIPYSSYDLYRRMLTGLKDPKKRVAFLGGCSVAYCTDTDPAFGNGSHKIRMRKCMWFRLPDGSDKQICTCTGYPEKFDSADPSAQDSDSGIRKGGGCPGTFRDPATGQSVPIYSDAGPPPAGGVPAQCQLTCAPGAECSPPTHYQLGTDPNTDQPNMVECPKMDEPNTSRSAEFLATPPTMCVWQ
ncbi:MAG: hypothetical protein HYY13_13680 [Nitrospirae bacterium]|nr:hypothetical protein [Nitrospirota bacterium]